MLHEACKCVLHVKACLVNLGEVSTEAYEDTKVMCTFLEGLCELHIDTQQEYHNIVHQHDHLFFNTWHLVSFVEKVEQLQREVEEKGGNM